MSGSPPADRVEVWALGTIDDALVHTVSGWLSPDEHERYGRLRVADDRERQVATRAMARHVLAARLGVDPGEVAFGEVGRGKPVLSPAGPAFSVTHCTGLSLVAVGDVQPIGVDAEPLDAVLEPEMAVRICTPRELERLDRLPARPRHEQLLRLWVRKEAVVKVDGRGLELDVAELDVWDPANVRGAERWGMEQPVVVDLDVGDRHVAALATTTPVTVDGPRRWSP